MLKSQSSRSDAIVEPAPAYADDAEIELAQRLRHQLEQRYLAMSQLPSDVPDRSGEDH